MRLLRLRLRHWLGCRRSIARKLCVEQHFRFCLPTDNFKFMDFRWAAEFPRKFGCAKLNCWG